MAEIVRMPKLSDTMTEGVVSKWLKKVGDKVKSGEILAEIDSDKATMEFESFYDGTLLYIGVPDKKGAPVDSILAIIGKEGENISAIVEAEKQKTSQNPETKISEPKATVSNSSKTEVTGRQLEKNQASATEQTTSPKFLEYKSQNAIGGRTKASPLAKKLAHDKGVPIAVLKGSGEDGRIVKRDIENFWGGYTGSQQVVSEESYNEIEISQMRKTIARRLSESKFTSPHFYLTMEINMGETIKTRELVNKVAQVKISYNDIIIKAVAGALRKHPKVNASSIGDVIRYNHHIHIGVAVAVEEGLLVPVVRFADGKTLSQIAIEVKTFAQKAKDKKLQPHDWEGNTFTISNLGMFGIDDFTAIINPPDACILAIGGIKETAVVRDGELVPGHVMKVTLSCDHRVVDGATGAAFLQTLKTLLENPVLLLGEQAI
ncbi:MAG: 2-oxo acid dehydrogenase subunit E2 [Bacteroidia bacterium]|nr:2-oxo acid dehydrogenase subunit E2 [Bacteroidia bacterium]